MISHPVALASDAFWLPACSPAPGGGELLSATLVVSGGTTALIGTGRADDQEEWADTVCSLVEAHDVRWIVLTMCSDDHVGGLGAALSAFPEARVAAPWAAWTPVHPAAGRWRRVAAGQQIDLGEVRLRFVHPGQVQGRPSLAVHIPERALLWLPDLSSATRIPPLRLGGRPTDGPDRPVAPVHLLVSAHSRPVPVKAPVGAEAGPRIPPWRDPRPPSRSGSSGTSS